MKEDSGDELVADVKRPKPILARRISRILIICFLVQLVTTTLVVHFIVSRVIYQSDTDSSQAVGHLIKNVLSTRLAKGWTRHEGDMLDDLGSDPRISFAAVVGSSGELFHASIFKPDDWKAYENSVNGVTSGRRFKTSITPVTRLNGGLSVRCFPIAVASPTGNTSEKSTKRPITVAVLLLGIQDKNFQAMIKGVHATQILTVASVGTICILMISFWVRRWLKPLNDVIRGINRLTNGRTPKPVTVSVKTELGYLATAFNHMAGRLMTARRDLEKSNEELEKRVINRTQELAVALERMDEMASTDPLTGIANRRALNDVFDNRLKAALMSGSDLICVLIDLDGFKAVNDKLGHDVGDELLMVAAQALKDASNERDLPARTGGDEFVLLLEGRSIAEAIKVAEQVQHQFQKEVGSVIAGDSSGVKVSMSIGVSSYKDNQPQTKEQMLRMADEAMYVAKQSGKARVEIFKHNQAA